MRFFRGLMELAVRLSALSNSLPMAWCLTAVMASALRLQQITYPVICWISFLLITLALLFPMFCRRVFRGRSIHLSLTMRCLARQWDCISPTRMAMSKMPRNLLWMLLAPGLFCRAAFRVTLAPSGAWLSKTRMFP